MATPIRPGGQRTRLSEVPSIRGPAAAAAASTWKTLSSESSPTSPLYHRHRKRTLPIMSEESTRMTLGSTTVTPSSEAQMYYYIPYYIVCKRSEKEGPFATCIPSYSNPVLSST